jgi:hypothetical protein
MRKLLPIVLLIISPLADAGAQSLQTQRKTIIFHHSEDWCSSCGDWGWALKDSLIRIQQSQVEFGAYNISVYSSSQSGLTSPITEDIGVNALPPITAIPSLTVDNLEIDVFNDFDWNADFDSTGDLVDPAVDSVTEAVRVEVMPPAKAAIGFSKTFKGPDSLIVKTRVKFPISVTGEYRVAVYAVEDSIYALQDDYNGSIYRYHRYVLHDAVQYGTWGQRLGGSSIPASTEYYNYFRMKLPGGWSRNRLQFFAIVYHKNGANYEIENVTNKASIEPSSVTTSQELGLSLFPNPVKDQLYLIGLHNPASAEVKVSDLSGKKVEVSSRVEGERLLIQLPAQLAAGNYMLQLAVEGQVITRTFTVGR